MFNADLFMQGVYTEANETKITPCPAGEYAAQITKVEPKSGTIANGERTGDTWAALNVQYTIQDPAVLQLLNRDKVFVSEYLMLDLTPQGGLDMGPQRNTKLGRLREATNLNQPGQPFSPTMFMGRSCRVSVRHVPGRKDPSEIVAEVTGYAKL